MTGEEVRFDFHAFVVKAGKVYDRITGPDGLDLNTYKKLWGSGDDFDGFEIDPPMPVAI